MFRAILEKVWDTIQLWKLRTVKGLYLEGKIVVSGSPIINISRGAQVIIDRNVTLNSRNRGYHISMYSPVKLFADQKGAIIRIGENTRIHGSCVHAYKSINIGKNCLIAANTNIFDANGHLFSFENISNRIFTHDTKSEAKSVVIEDNVWIGINSIILPGVTIGEGSIVAAGSIVTKNVPPLCIVGGNPAKVLRSYEK